jgi:hypothetical protein
MHSFLDGWILSSRLQTASPRHLSFSTPATVQCTAAPLPPQMKTVLAAPSSSSCSSHRRYGGAEETPRRQASLAFLSHEVATTFTLPLPASRSRSDLNLAAPSLASTEYLRCRPIPWHPSSSPHPPNLFRGGGTAGKSTGGSG